MQAYHENETLELPAFSGTDSIISKVYLKSPRARAAHVASALTAYMFRRSDGVRGRDEDVKIS